MYSRLITRSLSYVRPNYFALNNARRLPFLKSGPSVEILSQYEQELVALRNTPEVVDKLVGLVSKHPEIVTNIDVFRKLYPFPLDDFQIRSLQSLVAGNSVIVMTPTGSGKTLVGELAIYFALMMGLRVAYTTPLKALSNQKYTDFRNKFGADRVGLMTGDITVNRDAPIIIMTTEVFRNMVYSPENSKILSNLFMVCFDEFHYMNDPDRGTVWEESVISCPAPVRILALSATMGNVEEIQNWISSIHGPTDLVRSEYRPVPLRYFYASKSGMFPLFFDSNAGPGALNGIARDQHGKLDSSSSLNPAIAKAEESLLRRQSKQEGRFNRFGNRRDTRDVNIQRLIPRYGDVVQELLKVQKLPAIFFIFSRAGCESAAKEVMESKCRLLNKEELQYVNDALSVFIRSNPLIPISRVKVQLLQAGVGVHHAGLIPVWKSFIEDLFNANKIKVLFATETLAAGVNMPARTTVITSVTKKINQQIIKLKTSQMLQMAGRAGRRGKDIEGSVVIMRNRFEDPTMSHRILTSSIDGVKSHFRTSYSLTAKLLERKSLPDCKALIERGFGAYTLQQRLEKRDKLDDVTRNHRLILQKYGLKESREYLRLLRRLDNEQLALQSIAMSTWEQAQEVVESLIEYMPVGTALTLRNGVQGYFLGDLYWKASAEKDTTTASSTSSRDSVKGRFYINTGRGFASDKNSGNHAYYGIVTRENHFYAVKKEHILDFDTPVSSLEVKMAQQISNLVLHMQEWRKINFPLPIINDDNEKEPKDGSLVFVHVISQALRAQSPFDDLLYHVDVSLSKATAPSDVESTHFNPFATLQAAAIEKQQRVIDQVQYEVNHHPISLNQEKQVIIDAMQYLASEKVKDPYQFVFGNNFRSKSSLDEDQEETNESVTTTSGAVSGGNLLYDNNGSKDKDVFAWKMFHSIIDTLQAFYAVHPRNETHIRVLPLGETIASLSSENDLFMALLLHHPAIAGVAHSQRMRDVSQNILTPLLAEKYVKANKVTASFDIGPFANETIKITQEDSEKLHKNYEKSIFNIFTQTSSLMDYDDYELDGEGIRKNKKLKKKRDQKLKTKLERKYFDRLPQDEVEIGGSDDEMSVYDDEEAEEEDTILDPLSSPSPIVDSNLPNNEWEITDAYEFAGIIASTMIDEFKSQNSFFKPPIPSNILRLTDEIQSVTFQLKTQQELMSKRQGGSQLLDYPINFSPSISGVVYCWATGNYTWRELCQLTTLDQGDLCRILRRTVEFLRQIPETPHMSDKVLIMTWKAIKALDRFPVADTVDPAIQEAQEQTKREQEIKIREKLIVEKLGISNNQTSNSRGDETVKASKTLKLDENPPNSSGQGFGFKISTGGRDEMLDIESLLSLIGSSEVKQYFDETERKVEDKEDLGLLSNDDDEPDEDDYDDDEDDEEDDDDEDDFITSRTKIKQELYQLKHASGSSNPIVQEEIRKRREKIEEIVRRKYFG